MLINCIYAKEIPCGGRCVECQLKLYGGAPSVDVCNYVCKRKTPFGSTPKTTDEPLTGREKFDTCIFRSETSVSVVRKSCCSSSTVEGFRCDKFQYHPLTEGTCEDCSAYEKKQIQCK